LAILMPSVSEVITCSRYALRQTNATTPQQG
jgi:hypothetical protein